MATTGRLPTAPRGGFRREALWQAGAVAGLSEDLAFRGLIHQMTDEGALPARLDAGGMTLYGGFDPTGASLHVGNLLQLCTLRRFQLAGHRPIALAGGGTGFIGDPGGKSEERSLLSAEELAANLEGINVQLAQFIDLSASAGKAQGLVIDNSTWLGSIRLIEFLRDVGKHFTVNQMVAKESVRARFEREGQGISYTEFSYMLLQAYDFLRLYQDHGCELQIGGSDQWGNITMGVELIGKVARGAAYGLTSPLVTKSDGTKYGKTESGTVWLDARRTSPYKLYQFLLNTEDALVGAYLRYFTFLEHDQLLALDAETAEHPERRAAPRALAQEVCVLVHGAHETERAQRASRALFGEEINDLDEATLLDVVEDAPSSTIARSSLPLDVVEALAASGLVKSKSEARRAIDQGGIYLNNKKVDDPALSLSTGDLLHDRYLVLRKGRRDYHLLKVE
jgi:tyrosyl-tRNA synthetase